MTLYLVIGESGEDAGGTLHRAVAVRHRATLKVEVSNPVIWLMNCWQS